MDDVHEQPARPSGGPAPSLRRATLILNPRARRTDPVAQAGRIARYLEARGITVEVTIPESGAGATVAARRSADRGDDLCFAMGGDGTLRDIAQGLAHSPTALAALPGGTVNVWAKESGLPKGLRACLDAHITGQTVSIDLGRAGERCFILMASVGWDAAVTERVSMQLKRRVGDWAYILKAAQMLPGLRPAPVRWRSGIATEEARAAVIVLSNTRLYGGRVRFNAGALADDGLLDMVAVCPRNPVELVRNVAQLARSRLQAGPSVRRAAVDDLTIETPGLAVQLDGDFAGRTPMRFQVDRLALRMRVPPGPLPAILGGPALAGDVAGARG
ncbi:MAG: diacylglycerol/lipid kinase family protein [Dehalococcoidia bacterium]